MNKSVEVLISEKTGIPKEDVKQVIREYTASKKVNINLALVYVFSFMAFCMFLYVTFHKNSEKIRDQSIYWFFGALIAVYIPEVSRIKLKDLEVEFNRKIDSVKLDLENKISEKSLAIMNVITRQEERRSEQSIEERRKSIDGYIELLRTSTEEERLEHQQNFTKDNLYQWGLTISDLKGMLSTLGYFAGKINNDFTPELRDSISQFQTMNRLQVDGTCGMITLAKIHKLLQKK